MDRINTAIVVMAISVSTLGLVGCSPSEKIGDVTDIENKAMDQLEYVMNTAVNASEEGDDFDESQFNNEQYMDKILALADFEGIEIKGDNVSGHMYRNDNCDIRYCSYNGSIESLSESELNDIAKIMVASITSTDNLLQDEEISLDNIGGAYIMSKDIGDGENKGVLKVIISKSTGAKAVYYNINMSVAYGEQLKDLIVKHFGLDKEYKTETE